MYRNLYHITWRLVAEDCHVYVQEALEQSELFTSCSDLNWPWGVSTQNIRKRIKCLIDKQHMAKWRGLISTQRQARQLISVTVL